MSGAIRIYRDIITTIPCCHYSWGLTQTACIGSSDVCEVVREDRVKDSGFKVLVFASFIFRQVSNSRPHSNRSICSKTSSYFSLWNITTLILDKDASNDRKVFLIAVILTVVNITGMVQLVFIKSIIGIVDRISALV